jgi:hypothetical protein
MGIAHQDLIARIFLFAQRQAPTLAEHFDESLGVEAGMIGGAIYAAKLQGIDRDTVVGIIDELWPLVEDECAPPHVEPRHLRLVPDPEPAVRPDDDPVPNPEDEGA